VREEWRGVERRGKEGSRLKLELSFEVASKIKSVR